jgi:hypothetical protein
MGMNAGFRRTPSGVHVNELSEATDMGFEYKICANLPSTQVGDRILANAASGLGKRNGHGFEYRAEESDDSAPDAVAKVEHYGFYFRESGHHGLCAGILGFIVAAAASYGPVWVEEL